MSSSVYADGFSNNSHQINQLDMMERKRQEHIQELIFTEEVYIQDMQLVHEVNVKL